jgi:hypothetical protein
VRNDFFSSRLFGIDPDLLIGGAIFFVTLIVFWLSPVHQVTDSRYSMLLSQSLLKYHSFALDHYSISASEVQQHGQLKLINNHLYYNYPPGASVLSLPFVAIMNAFHTTAVNPDGTYKPKGEVKMQATIAALLMAVLAGIFFFTCRLILPRGWSALIALGAAFGTQIWSTASRSLWSHTWQITLLGIVIWMLVAQETGKRKLKPAMLATLLSWMYFARPTSAISIVAITVYLLLFYRRFLVSYAAVGAAWLVLFVAYSEHHFGRGLPDYFQLPLQFRNAPAALAGVLVSPSRGLLVYVPVVLFVIYLLIRYWRWIVHRRLAWLAVSVILAHIAICSGFTIWWGGGCYGARLMTELVPWFVLLVIEGLGGRLKYRVDHRAPLSAGNWQLPLICGGVLLGLSIFINARGALSQETWRWENWRWNAVPAQRDNQALWQWRYPQFLAGLIKPPLPGEFPLLDRRIDLSSEDAAKYLWYGWSGPESQSRWTDGPEAALIFRLSEVRETVLEMKAGPFLAGKLLEQNVIIDLNEHAIATLRLTDPQPQVYSIVLPGNFLRETNVLRFALPNASSLDALNLGEDPRLLAVNVSWIRVAPATNVTGPLR